MIYLKKFFTAFLLGFSLNMGVFAASYFLNTQDFYKDFLEVSKMKMIKIPKGHVTWEPTSEKHTVTTPTGSTFYHE